MDLNMMIEGAPSVSVCVFTYNQEKYIEQCINSVLMQRTDFPYEIIIGEDYSTDKTREICLKYLNNDSNIRVLDRGKNLKLPGNYYDTLKQATGKYIALIDGDDYWINPFKLQKQFDFMERNPEYSICFHQVIRLHEDNKNSIDLFVKEYKPVYSLSDILKKWTMATGSVFFRKEKVDFPEFLLHTINFDTALQWILLRDNSRAGYIDEVMSIYRINEGSNTNNSLYDVKNTGLRTIRLCEDYNAYTQLQYDVLIREKIKKVENKLKAYKYVTPYRKIKQVLKRIIYLLGYKITITRK